MLTEENLKELRAELERQRQELLADRNYEEKVEADMARDTFEEHPLSNHMGDLATDEFEQTMAATFDLEDQRRLEQIDHALQLMDEGKYGYDEQTGEEIPFERLQALPYATRTVQNQAKADMEAGPQQSTLLQDDVVQNELSS